MEDNQTKFVNEVLQRLTRIETKLEGITDVKNTVIEANVRIKKNENDIKKLQENQSWLWKTIVGALIVGIFGIITSFIEFKIIH